jgi:hypothetical protein
MFSLRFITWPPRCSIFSHFCNFQQMLLFSAMAVGLLACREAKPRSYTEIAYKTNPSSMGMPGAGGMGAGAMPPMNMSPVDIKVTWILPETWYLKDSANAMRIGSFAAPDPSLVNMGEEDTKAVDISVVQLAGDAGGLEANILRWMGQIGIKATAEEMGEMIRSAPHFKTTTGQDGILVDLTDKLSGDMTQSNSIYGAVIQTAEYTVFVKAMGERNRVIKLKATIDTFCKSLAITGPKA